jgi:predicted nucleic acid-binding protein
MTLYAETSAVLRWLFDEAQGEEIEQLLRGASKVVCSRLTLIEVRRVVRRATVLGQIDEAAASDLFDAFALAAARWGVLELSREVGERAEERFPIEPVRTLDALHLASALTLRHALADLQLLSTDQRVRENGVRLGLEVVPA